MKLSHLALKPTHQKVHSLLDRRYAERVAFRCQITYSGEEGARIVTGEGTLKNLSKTGCKILGMTTSSLGGSLTLHLHLADGQAPLRLTDVIVTGIEKGTFSVRFPSLSSTDRKRLQNVVWKNVSLSSGHDRRVAFRIV